eukprot:TRINITY_DN7535_c0_g4_i1.p1 TRINITY_DN7535_c0_g4~~TRINITY_DN7535_c0_g4_i1.p1  ORF type:complete len:197 (-),score=49.93 TRINITY_DN7535_c0_g4_i1:299-889(-)
MCIRDRLTNSTLNDLDLSSNQITDKGLEGIMGGILKNRTLEGLNLSENKLGDVGGQRLLHSIVQNTQIKRLKIGMNCICKRFIAEMEACAKKNVVRAENERRSMIVSQFAALKEALTKCEQVKKETESVVKQKKTLKKQLLEDIQILNNAHENKEKDLDNLKEEIEELLTYEKDLDKGIEQLSDNIKVSFEQTGRK